MPSGWCAAGPSSTSTATPPCPRTPTGLVYCLVWTATPWSVVVNTSSTEPGRPLHTGLHHPDTAGCRYQLSYIFTFYYALFNMSGFKTLEVYFNLVFAGVQCALMFQQVPRGGHWAGPHRAPPRPGRLQGGTCARPRQGEGYHLY